MTPVEMYRALVGLTPQEEALLADKSATEAYAQLVTFWHGLGKSQLNTIEDIARTFPHLADLVRAEQTLARRPRLPEAAPEARTP